MFQFPGNNNQQSNNQRQGGRAKADAYINVRIPRKNTDPNQPPIMSNLGSVELRGTTPAMTNLINWLKEDPSRISALMSTAEFDFRMADGSSSADFVLPDTKPAQSTTERVSRTG